MPAAGGTQPAATRWLAPIQQAARARRPRRSRRTEGQEMSLAEAVCLRARRTSPRRPGAADRAGRSPSASWRWRPWSRRASPTASIAGQLYLSVRTVDTHVDHVLTKLGFSNRAQLAAWAYESRAWCRKIRRTSVVLPMSRRAPARSADAAVMPQRTPDTIARYWSWARGRPVSTLACAAAGPRRSGPAIIDKGDGAAPADPRPRHPRPHARGVST